MRDVNYLIHGVWEDDPLTPAEIGRRFLATLEALQRVDSVFDGWQAGDYVNGVGVSLDKVRQDPTAYVTGLVARDDYGEPDPDYGYGAMAVNNESRSPQSLTLMLKAGGRFSNRLNLTTGDFLHAPDPAILTYPIFKGALLAIVAQWPHPMTAQLYRPEYYETPLTPGAPLFPYSIFHIPWIAYLPPSLAAGAAGPPGILTEPTPDGGLLLIAAETTLDIANPEHMLRSRAIAEFMVARTRRS